MMTVRELAFRNQCSRPKEGSCKPPQLEEDLVKKSRLQLTVGDCGCNSDLNTRVSLLSQLALEELVQLSEEDTIGHELASLGAIRRSVFEVSWKFRRRWNVAQASGNSYIAAPGTDEAILTIVCVD